jgi:lipooligosaccharide transport system ATP-binding protein
MQEDALDEAMTVRDNMLLFCRFHQIPKAEAEKRVDQLLGDMSLKNKSHSTINALSGGMKRRLTFVRSLLCKPKILILDEPTTGLDPAVRHVLWEKIRTLKNQGTTIILTTHYMDEAEILCDRLVIMDQGVIKGEGSPKELIAHHCPGYVVLHQSGRYTIRREFASLELLTAYLGQFPKSANPPHIQSVSSVEESGLPDHPATPPSMIRPSNLEDVFLKLTGRELDDNA